MNDFIEIDVRGLAPPEPFELIVPALYKLLPGATLKVLIHREPFPLYDILRESGYIWRTRKLPDSGFKIQISRPAE
ncbi:MAG: DUF2249 domain-containing protein [Gallionellaceae bacterium]|jgi:uncharacterized protein (DUF2249 family)